MRQGCGSITVLVVAAIGESGSGKTFTIEYLVSNFQTQGYAVGCIKHVHHRGFTIDKEGTNTWRYAKAGAKVIVAVSPEEIDIIKKTTTELNDLDEIVKLIEAEKLDVVFVEGFHGLIAKKADVVKIITAKDTSALDLTLKGTVQPIIAITGVITKKTGFESYGGIPLIRIPEDGQKLINLINQRLKQDKLDKIILE